MSGRYVIDAARPGRFCDAAIHGDQAVVALVATSEGEHWCAVHWGPVADLMSRDGYEIAYTPAARVRLGVGAG